MGPDGLQTRSPCSGIKQPAADRQVEESRVIDKQLRGHLELAGAASPRIDEIRKLVEADILRAASASARRNPSRGRNLITACSSLSPI
jgi:hypothetical protein